MLSSLLKLWKSFTTGFRNFASTRPANHPGAKNGSKDVRKAIWYMVDLVKRLEAEGR